MTPPPLSPLTRPNQVIRDSDKWGSGAFDAPRGNRRHRGLDILTHHGQTLYSPVSGTITRYADPYEDDPRYSGCLIQGSGPWSGYDIKVFYLEQVTLGIVDQDTHFAIAQDIERKYPGILNHVHLEVWHGKTLIDPTPFVVTTLT